MAELTVEDYRMIKYFWEEKGDITAWEAWSGKKHLFRKRHPELAQAVKQLVIAELTFFAIVKTICSENTWGLLMRNLCYGALTEGQASF